MSSMKNIPQDIIIDILHRLPTKSVGRFRCVSKEWLSLLTDPQFIETHQKTLTINRVIFGSNDGSLYSVPYNNMHEAVPTQTTLDFGFYRISSILGSVNGLVLATAFKNLHTYVPLLLLNPTTKDFVELPISNLMQLCGIIGIGYDYVSDDYKVVVISTFDNYSGHVHVYSLRTNTWKQATRSPYDLNDKSWSPGVFANGYLHWIFGSHSNLVIVAFSLANDNLSELPPPDLCNEVDIVSALHTKLVALGEKLAIFDKVKGDVWLMNEYGAQKSWTKIVVRGFEEIRMLNGIRMGKSPEVFFDSGKILFLTSYQLWIYDVEERTPCKKVDISYMNIGYVLSANYAESFVSPKFSTSN